LKIAGCNATVLAVTIKKVLFLQFQSHRNLSQLPNFAFSVPLALYHLGKDKGDIGHANKMVYNESDFWVDLGLF